MRQHELIVDDQIAGSIDVERARNISSGGVGCQLSDINRVHIQRARTHGECSRDGSGAVAGFTFGDSQSVYHDIRSSSAQIHCAAASGRGRAHMRIVRNIKQCYASGAGAAQIKPGASESIRVEHQCPRRLLQTDRYRVGENRIRLSQLQHVGSGARWSSKGIAEAKRGTGYASRARPVSICEINWRLNWPQLGQGNYVGFGQEQGACRPRDIGNRRLSGSVRESLDSNH